MKIPEELIIGIEKWSVQELWNTIKVIEDEISKENYNKIKYGIKIKFHLNRYLEGLYTEKNKSEKIIMNGNEINQEELWNEIEEREKIMRKQLIKNTERKSIIRPTQNV